MSRKSLTQQLAEAKERLSVLERENQALQKKPTLTIQDSVISNEQSPPTESWCDAAHALADAAMANARAIEEIAKSWKNTNPVPVIKLG